jgi:hypothetical protein
LVEAVVREDNNDNLFYDFDLTTRKEMQAERFSTAKSAGAVATGAATSGNVPDTDTETKDDSAEAASDAAADNINLPS